MKTRSHEMDMNFNSSFVCNSQRIANNLNVFPAVNGWTNLGHPYNGLLLSSEKSGTAASRTTWMALKVVMLSEKDPSQKVWSPLVRRSPRAMENWRLVAGGWSWGGCDSAGTATVETDQFCILTGVVVTRRCVMNFHRTVHTYTWTHKRKHGKQVKSE